MVICSSNTYCLGYFVYFVLCCSAATVQREALCDFRCRHRHSLVQCIWTSCTHVFLFILDMWALFLLRLQPPKRNEWVWVIALLKFTFSIYQNKSGEAEKNRMLLTFFRHFRKLLPFSMLCAGCTNMEAQTMAQYASRKFSKLYDKSYCVCLNFIKTNLFLICISTLPCIAKWIEASLGEWISNSEFQWYHLSMPEMPYCNFRWRTA